MDMDTLLFIIFGINVVMGIGNIIMDGWKFIAGTLGWVCAIIMLLRITGV